MQASTESAPMGSESEPQCEQKVSERPDTSLSMASTRAPADDDDPCRDLRLAFKRRAAGGCPAQVPLIDTQKMAGDGTSKHAITKWESAEWAAKPLRRPPSEAFWRSQQWALRHEPLGILDTLHQVRDRDYSPEKQGETKRAAPRNLRAARVPKLLSLFGRARAERLDALRAAADPAVPQPTKPAGAPPARRGARPTGAVRYIVRGVEGGLAFGAVDAGTGSLTRSSGSTTLQGADEVAAGFTSEVLAGGVGAALRKVARKRQ